MLRDFEDCIEIEHGKRKFNFDKIYAVFNNELNDKNRLLSKLKDKNKVLKHQKAKLLRSVHTFVWQIPLFMERTFFVHSIWWFENN